VPRSTSARRAPSSTTTAPSDPQLAGRQLALVGLERRAHLGIAEGVGQHLWAPGRGDHGTHTAPRCHSCGRELRGHAAAPAIRPALAGLDREQRIIGRDTGDQRRRRIDRWVGGVQAVGVGEQHQEIGGEVVRDEGRDPVVVPEADLVARDRVVLVHHRHAAELEQPLQRAARVEVLPPIDEVVRHQEHLRAHRIVTFEGSVPCVHHTALTGSGQGLQRRRVGGSGSQTECVHASAHRARRHDHHLVPVTLHRTDLFGQRPDHRLVDHAEFIGERRRPDLHHHTHERLPVSGGRRAGTRS
jgi:hypothetical protein